jgi:hypothetical protein
MCAVHYKIIIMAALENYCADILENGWENSLQKAQY